MLRFDVKCWAFAASLVLLSSGAFAQVVPSAFEQEVLVRTTLLTFNDANLTGNYTVLNEKGSKPFREQLTADKLKDGFKGFVEKRVNISGVAGRPIPAPKAEVDANGVLVLTGAVPISDTYKVNYVLKFAQSEGEWKVIGLDVKT